MVNFAKLMIRISPVMLALFLIVPIGISGYASIYDFELDSTMDAFSIRDHPAAEDFSTFVNARDLARAQKEQEWYVTGNCTADDPQLAYRRKLLGGVDEGFDGNTRFLSSEPDHREGRSLQQADQAETWELQFCDRMRFYLTYVAREGGLHPLGRGAPGRARGGQHREESSKVRAVLLRMEIIRHG